MTKLFTYESVSDLMAIAEANPSRTRRINAEGAWFGVESFADMKDLVANGWHKDIDGTLAIVNNAVDWIYDTTEVPSWQSYHDVSGGSVDVAAYLDGEPECMIESLPVKIRKDGRVVTIVLSAAVSASVHARTITKRGQYYLALVTLLQRAGYGVDLWIDSSARRSHKTRIADKAFRLHVMSPGDVVDLPRLTYLLMHPSVLRVLFFSAQDKNGIPATRSYPANPVADFYPEDAILTNSVTTNADFDIASKLQADLIALGITEA